MASAYETTEFDPGCIWYIYLSIGLVEIDLLADLIGRSLAHTFNTLSVITVGSRISSNGHLTTIH
jgi:hypothetical protein